MPLSVSCHACKRQYSLAEELYQSRIAGHTVSFLCKECGATAIIDGTKDEGPKVLDDGEKVAGSLTADDLGPDPNEIDEIDDEEVASLPPESLKQLAEALGPAAQQEALWIVNEEEGADDEEVREQELLKRISSGKILADAIVWREGMSDWLPVADVPVLAKHLPKAGGDKTGGFLGTGMKPSFDGKDAEQPRGESKSVPPPLPPKKRSSDPRGGKPVALSRGLLFSVDDDETKKAEEAKKSAPKQPEPKKFAPKPPLKSKPAVTRDLDFSDISDEDPVPSSTGTPALTALTSKAPQAPKQQPKKGDDFLMSLGGGDEEVLGPPSIDISDLSKRGEEEAPESEVPESESPPSSEVPESASAPSSTTKKKKKKKKKGKKAGASRAPRATASRRPKASQPAKARQAESTAAPASEERSGGIWKLVVLAALVGGVLFYMTRQKSDSAPEQTPEPAPKAAGEGEPSKDLPKPTAEPNEPAAATESEADKEPKTPDTKERPAKAEPKAASEKKTGATETKTKIPSTSATEPKEPEKKVEAKKEEKPKEEKKVEAKKPASDAPPFDKAAAVAALNAAVGQASGCRQPGDPSGTARVVITFAPSGRVTSANLSGPPFAGTRTGGCIASTMRRARVPAFSGSHVTVSKSVVIR